MNQASIIHSLLFFNTQENSLPLSFDSEAILDSLLKESTDCIAIKDTMGRYIWINPAGEAYLGKELESVLGKTDMELFFSEAAEKIMLTDRAVMDSGQTQSFKSVLRPLNERPRLFQAVKCPYRNASGAIVGVINIVRNIEMSDEMLKMQMTH